MNPLRTDCLDKLTNEQRRAFARWCALRCVDKWDATDVARRYLETGDEKLRAAARAAALDAARAAARAAAYYTSSGAYDAACAAVYAACVLYITARDVVCSTARTAACAADDIDAERAAQNAKLAEMAGEES